MLLSEFVAKQVSTGYTAAHMQDAIEAVLLMRTIIVKIIIRAIETAGNTPIAAPAAVATPLPPLNLKKTGKQCPTCAKNPAKRMHSVGASKKMTSSLAIITAMNPFAKSQKNTNAAAFFPHVRKTLVAPALPLPVVRMSFPYRFSVIITAKLMLPITYEIMLEIT